MSKKILICLCLWSSVFSLQSVVCNARAQENITITTYYPSPFGSYNELETGTLFFNEGQNGLISFHYPDQTYDRRLRITAGRADTGDNSQGASIDLHGNNHANAGRLDLVAGSGGALTFWTSTAGNSATERMRITDDGNVGIGTTAPGSLLHIRGNTTTTALIETPTATFAARLGLRNTARTWYLDSDGGNPDAFVIREGVVGTATTNDRFSILPGGNVGIGTTTPGQSLSVNGVIEAGPGTVNLPAYLFFPATQTYGATGMYAPAANTIGFVTSGGERVRIDNSGNVGIGTTDPKQALDVNGYIRFGLPQFNGGGGLLYAVGNGHGNYGGSEAVLTVADGLGGSKDEIWIGPHTRSGGCGIGGHIQLCARNIHMRGTVVYNSDLRLKNEITPIPNALEKVSALRGVNFKWRENCGSSGFHMGLIGQEVEKVFPELVTTDPDSMKSISYTELSAALVEAIKELKSQGEKEIARLTKENAALKKRLEAVEKKLNERL